MEELNLDQDFLMRFSCMGTQDKDVLISQLHGILDSQLSREGCIFFLDMTNWNLQAAVGAFYDHYSSEGGVMPEMTLVERKTVGDQSAAALTLPANAVFTETWTLRNTGTMPWPLGVHLTVKTGEILSNLRNLHLPMLPPGGQTSVTLEFHAPSSAGVYHCQWRACTGGGALFGDPVWVIVRVPDDETVLGLANQLSTITTHEADMESESTEADRTDHGAAPNPFATPSYQEHPFGSGSMMTSPHSIPTGACLERLLMQNQPPSPSGVDHTPHPTTPTGQDTLVAHLGPVTATADSTTHPCSVPARMVSNQNQILEWNSSIASTQNQTLEWNQPQPPGTPSANSSTAMMEDTSSETNTT